MHCDTGAIDLHIHSDKSSDGDCSPFHLICLAREEGLKAIAISDHDTVAAYPEALRIGKEEGVEIIPSIELTTLFDGREFHLLLPFVDWKNTVLKGLIDQVAESRFLEARERVEKLRDLGFDITWEDVMRESGSLPPLGVTIAQAVLEKPGNNGDPNLKEYLEGRNKLFAPYFFYRDYFAEGKPAAVPRRNIALLEVLKVAPQTGGVPVLAHPGAPFQRVNKDDLAELRSKGLEGIEVYTSYHDAPMAELYRTWAEEYGLVPTAGSDFHGRIKPHVAFGSVKKGGYWMVEELKKRRP